MFGFVVGGGGATEGSVNHLGNFGASDTVDFTLGQNPNRWVIVVQAEYNSNRFNSTLSSPSVNGTSMTEAVNTNNGYSDDGHRAGIWYARVPSGSSFTYADGGSGLCSIFEVFGVVNLGDNLNIHSRTTDPGNCASEGEGTVSNLPGFSIGVTVRNGGDYTTTAISNASIVGSGSNSVIYLDSPMDSLTVSYEGNNPNSNCSYGGGSEGAFVIEHTLSCDYDLEIL